jgi:hypothetical protein
MPTNNGEDTGPLCRFCYGTARHHGVDGSCPHCTLGNRSPSAIVAVPATYDVAYAPTYRLLQKDIRQSGVQEPLPFPMIPATPPEPTAGKINMTPIYLIIVGSLVLAFTAIIALITVIAMRPPPPPPFRPPPPGATAPPRPPPHGLVPDASPLAIISYLPHNGYIERIIEGAK